MLPFNRKHKLTSVFGVSFRLGNVVTWWRCLTDLCPSHVVREPESKGAASALLWLLYWSAHHPCLAVHLLHLRKPRVPTRRIRPEAEAGFSLKIFCKWSNPASFPFVSMFVLFAAYAPQPLTSVCGFKWQGISRLESSEDFLLASGTPTSSPHRPRHYYCFILH